MTTWTGWHRKKIYGDTIFEQGRTLSHDFSAGIVALFFDLDDGLAHPTKQYGVF